MQPQQHRRRSESLSRYESCPTNPTTSCEENYSNQNCNSIWRVVQWEQGVSLKWSARADKGSLGCLGTISAAEKIANRDEKWATQVSRKLFFSNINRRTHDSAGFCTTKLTWTGNFGSNTSRLVKSNRGRYPPQQNRLRVGQNSHRIWTNLVVVQIL